jgi:hypothetical protein
MVHSIFITCGLCLVQFISRHYKTINLCFSLCVQCVNFVLSFICFAFCSFLFTVILAVNGVCYRPDLSVSYFIFT